MVSGSGGTCGAPATRPCAIRAGGRFRPRTERRGDAAPCASF